MRSELNSGKKCIITMVKNDTEFFRIWMRYYSRFFGKSDIFVINNSCEEDFFKDEMSGVSIIRIPEKFQGEFPRRSRFNLPDNFDGSRAMFVSDFSNGLLNYYDTVMYTDVDEIIAPDPKFYSDLGTYLDDLDGPGAIAPIGMNLIHMTDSEGKIDLSSETILEQRRHVMFKASCTKPILKSRPLIWTAGFHGCNKHFDIRKNLFLFHLKTFDIEIFEKTQRKRNSDFLSQGKGENSSWVKSSEKARTDFLEKTKKANIYPSSEFELSIPDYNLRKSRTGRFRVSQSSESEIMLSRSIYRLPDRFMKVF